MNKEYVIKKINENLFKSLNEDIKPTNINETRKILNAKCKEFNKAAKDYIKAIKFNGFETEGDHLASIFNSGVGGFIKQVKDWKMK